MHTLFLWATASVWVFFLFYWNAIVVTRPPARQPAAESPSDATPARRPWVTFRFKPSPAGQAVRGQPVRRSEPHSSRLFHVLLLWAALLIALLPGFGPLGRRYLPDAPYWGPVGLTAQLAFAALYLWGKRVLGRNWSGEITIKADHYLVRTGPYRVLRHPLYTGMIGMFLGTAIVWGEWHALVGLALCCIAYARKIVLEERQLREEFGDAYKQYRRSTWAVIPGVL